MVQIHHEVLADWRMSGPAQAGIDPVVPIDVYHTIPTDGQPASPDAPLLYTLGIGEGRQTAQKVLEFLGALGETGVRNVVIAPLPFYHHGVHDDENLAARLQEVATEVPAHVARWAVEKTQPADGRVLAIGRSQGAAPLVMSAAEDPNLFGNIAQISPFGIGIDMLGTSTTTRAWKLYSRIVKNLGRQTIRDTEVIAGGLELTNNLVIHGPKKKLLHASMKAALGSDQDTTERTVALANDGTRKMAVLMAEHDPLWRPDEQQAALAGHQGYKNVTVIPVNGAHVGSATRRGKEQLAIADDFVRGKAVA